MADQNFASINVDVESKHRDALKKLLGIDASEEAVACGKLPPNPARSLMASKERFDEKSLTDRWLYNGIVLMQCYDFFSEFLPTKHDNSPAPLDDKQYMERILTLIRDENGIFIERLSHTATKKIHDVFITMREFWLDENSRRHIRLLRNATGANLLLLSVIDQRVRTIDEGCTRSQHHFGLRKNSTFAVRMVTRLLQWREYLENPHQLVLDWAAFTVDILPADAWTPERRNMAVKFAQAFNKPAPEFPALGIPANIHVSPGIADTPTTKLLKDVIARMAAMELKLDKALNKLAAVEVKQDKELNKLGEMNDALASFRLDWRTQAENEAPFVRKRKQRKLE